MPVEEAPDKWGEDLYTRSGRIRYKIRWNRLERKQGGGREGGSEGGKGAEQPICEKDK